METNEEKKNLGSRIKYICSITVKNDGRALDIIFVLCLISIIGFSVFLYRTSTDFYVQLEQTMQNNINLNIEAMQNEHLESIQNWLDLIDSNNNTKDEVAEQLQSSE